jgi:hypothetical protein
VRDGPFGEIHVVHAGATTKLGSLSPAQVAKLGAAMSPGTQPHVAPLCALAARADDEGQALYVGSSDPRCVW